MKIGILALQGAFLEHKQALERLGVSCIEIRQKKDLASIDGIILPGGESTVQSKLLRSLDLFTTIQSMINQGLPVLATCAGLILLAQNITPDQTHHFATLPATVKRNAYGRQLGSFSTTGTVGDLKEFPLTFIRAPYITQIGEDVEILSTIDQKIVGVKYKNQIGLAFHPEMTDDLRIHKEFLKLVENVNELPKVTCVG
ncbi:MAG: pyridoxal 5'-phosphate synthase glutaminase subunit PdxT [Lachnospiraceae bacterium]|nr:pyridoxal 5'-phosphate synthase glutaminase subunit PdxT [Lachnospiraceae bacterium]